MEEKKSLAVLFSLLSRLRESGKRDSIIREIEHVLTREGVCSESDIQKQTDRYEQLIGELENKMKEGLSYKRAYKALALKYPEFTNTLNIWN